MLSKKTLAREIALVAEKAGVRKANANGGPSQRHKVMLTHGLRKFFRKNCRKAGLDALTIEQLIGHKTGNPEFGITTLMHVYDPIVEDDLMKEYLRAVDGLTIDPANRLQKQVKELEVKAKAADKVEALEKKVAESTVKHDAVSKQMAELAEKNRRMEERQALYDDLLSDPTKLKKFLDDTK